MKFLFTILFLLSLGLNCAYMTGCCSFHIPTSDTCGDHSKTATASDDAEKRLRKVAGELNVSVSSEAKADTIEDILLSEVKKAKRYEFGQMSNTNVLSSLRKDARAFAAEADFDILCELIKKADGKRILILEP